MIVPITVVLDIQALVCLWWAKGQPPMNFTSNKLELVLPTLSEFFHSAPSSCAMLPLKFMFVEGESQVSFTILTNCHAADPGVLF